MKLGVVIGRFQVPYLHKGHVTLIEEACKNSDQVLVLVGTSEFRSKRNPLTYREVSYMLSEIEFSKPITLRSVEDCPTDREWSSRVDSLIAVYEPTEVVLYGGRDSFIPHYTGRYTTRLVETVGSCSGTALREQVAATYEASTLGERRQVVASWQRQFEVVPVAVDIVVLTKGKRILGDEYTGILLGRKRKNDGLRLPGGFLDKTDLSIRHAASRELKEETNIEIPPEQFEIREGRLVKDWRFDYPVYCPTAYVKISPPLVYYPGDDFETVKVIDLAGFSEPGFPEVFPGHKDVIDQILKEEGYV